MQPHDRTANVPTENDRRTLELARLGYQAYYDHANGKAIHGEQMPSFEALPHPILSHWIAAAERIESEVLSNLPPNDEEAAKRASNSNPNEIPAASRRKAAIEAITTASVESEIELEEGEADLICEEYGDDEVLANPAKALDKWESTPDDKRKGKSKGRAARH